MGFTTPFRIMRSGFHAEKPVNGAGEGSLLEDGLEPVSPNTVTVRSQVNANPATYLIWRWHVILAYG